MGKRIVTAELVGKVIAVMRDEPAPMAARG